MIVVLSYLPQNNLVIKREIFRGKTSEENPQKSFLDCVGQDCRIIPVREQSENWEVGNLSIQAFMLVYKNKIWRSKKGLPDRYIKGEENLHLGFAGEYLLSSTIKGERNGNQRNFNTHGERVNYLCGQR
jgi:hypothetical protein